MSTDTAKDRQMFSHPAYGLQKGGYGTRNALHRQQEKFIGLSSDTSRFRAIDVFTVIF
jgi:hypothetical protein